MRDVIDCKECGGQAVSMDAEVYSCDCCGSWMLEGVWHPGEESSDYPDKSPDKMSGSTTVLT